MAATAVQIREHYDALALIYRAFWGDHLHHGLFESGDETPEQAQLKLLAHCASLAGVRRGSRVLDVGCGHGGTAVFLAQEYECSVVGLTLSSRQARLAEQETRSRNVQPSVQFIVGDADCIDFGHGLYDLVWTMESSEHFRDKAAYFRRVAKAMAPEGKLLLAAWTGSMQHEGVCEVARAFLCPTLQTAEEYARQMEAAGLRVLTQEEFTSKVERTWEICQEHARKAAAVLPLMPRAVREFVEGIPVILGAYRSRALRYTVITASR